MAKPDDRLTRDIRRMEAFSDAVFAIAITLPIVEVQVPKAAADLPGLAAELLGLWRSYLGYFMTFVVIGLFWSHHHFSGIIYRKVNHGFLLMTLLFLMAVGFVAFPTRVLAEYLGDPIHNQTATTFYVAALLVASLAWLLKWVYGVKDHLVDERLEPAYVARLTRKYTLTSAAYLVALLLSFPSPYLALGLAAAITLLYLRAPEPPVYRGEHPQSG